MITSLWTRRAVLAAGLLACAAPARAQPAADTTAHRLPFASAGNTFALTVANTAGAPLADAAVAVVAAPDWLSFSAVDVGVGALDADAEVEASFSFDVAAEAPVGQAGEVVFEVRSGAAIVGTRTLRVVVEPPGEVALAGPWPNPARGEARIAVDLPAAGHADVRLYDLLGREVARLVDGERAAGRHEVAFPTSALAAGLYMVRLSARDPHGRPTVVTRRLTVLR
jgi:hypothetical protein